METLVWIIATATGAVGFIVEDETVGWGSPATIAFLSEKKLFWVRVGIVPVFRYLEVFGFYIVFNVNHVITELADVEVLGKGLTLMLIHYLSER